MRISVLLALILAAHMRAQTAEVHQNSADANTHGACSPAISGSHNTIDLANCGIGEKQGGEIVALLKKVLAGQTAQERDTKLAALQKVSYFSENEMEELIHRSGPFFGDIHLIGNNAEAGMLDESPCPHTVVGLTVEGAKKAIEYKPSGPCFALKDLERDRSSGRRISCDENSALINYLAPHAGKIEIGYSEQDSESFKYALDWFKVFTDAGWQVVGNGPLPGTTDRNPASGISALIPGTGDCIPRDQSSPARVAMNAMSGRSGIVGVQCSARKDKDTIIVFVGRKQYPETKAK